MHGINIYGISMQSCSLDRYQVPADYTAPKRDLHLEGIQHGDVVAVAMSGGVDSSVVAALLHEKGYKVIGITLQLYDHGKAIQKQKACCAGQDIYDAQKVAFQMGFPHYVLNYESIFKQKVIDDFANSYVNGETPVPCIQCNQQVKFKDLLQFAKDLDAKALVTGHYVQRTIYIKDDKTFITMQKAMDHNKDQSYFLFGTTTEELSYLRFPLGVFDSKLETRYHAKRFNLPVASKPDSQDICFVPNGDYRSIVEKIRPEAIQPGNIVDSKGNILGIHQGIINYTIGQRKGLGISSHEPLYVVKIDPNNNQVIVGPKEDLAKKVIYLKDMNWLVAYDKNHIIDCRIKIRSSGVEIPAKVHILDQNMAEVHLVEPEYGISRGQAGVLYDNDTLLGGGWII